MESKQFATAGDLPPNPARRQFIQTVGILGAGMALEGNAAAQSDPSAGRHQIPAAGSDEIPRRPLGRTGVQVSAIGIGGHHLGDISSVDEAIRLVHEAVDAGINFFGNAWEYYNGKTENWLGRALKGRRDKIVLMTKVCTHGRSGQLALRMLEESLQRLQTDHLDVWQIHGIVYDNDPELAYAKGGVLEAFDQAKQQGKVRFVGFTGHKEPAFHLEMIQRGYPFDTVQMPLNPFDASFHSFEQQVLPELNRRGIAALGMKSMGGTADSVKKGVVKAEELLRYAMSLPVATTICGMDSLDVLRQNLRVARGFTPMTENEMNALRARCASTAADGRFEPYKVSLKYDNPVTRMPHGFPVDPTQREVKQMLEQGTGTWEPL
jgi:aryl-alcohol dehydrogenase-like predicted oxidoreductase